jgi:hypothetical protein
MSEIFNVSFFDSFLQTVLQINLNVIIMAEKQIWIFTLNDIITIIIIEIVSNQFFYFSTLTLV